LEEEAAVGHPFTSNLSGLVGSFLLIGLLIGVYLWEEDLERPWSQAEIVRFAVLFVSVPLIAGLGLYAYIYTNETKTATAFLLFGLAAVFLTAEFYRRSRISRLSIRLDVPLDVASNIFRSREARALTKRFSDRALHELAATLKRQGSNYSLDWFIDTVGPFLQVDSKGSLIEDSVLAVSVLGAIRRHGVTVYPISIPLRLAREFGWPSVERLLAFIRKDSDPHHDLKVYDRLLRKNHDFLAKYGIERFVDLGGALGKNAVWFFGEILPRSGSLVPGDSMAEAFNPTGYSRMLLSKSNASIESALNNWPASDRHETVMEEAGDYVDNGTGPHHPWVSVQTPYGRLKEKLAISRRVLAELPASITH
jgi:hypothetical protein